MTVKAIYEQGVFRPREPVHLPDQCAVEIEFHVVGKPLPALAGDGGDPSHAATPSIEEKLAALAKAVPDAEWNRLPADLSDQLDHYIYGTPRR